MRILKDIDRHTFKSRFTTKEDCYNFMAEFKWQEGISLGLTEEIHRGSILDKIIHKHVDHQPITHATLN